MLDLVKILKTVRFNQGLTQEALSKKLGVSFATVNRWENGKNKPSRFQLEQIKALAEPLVGTSFEVKAEKYALKAPIFKLILKISNPAPDKIIIQSTSQAVDLVRDLFEESVEVAVGLFLNPQDELIGRYDIARGTSDEVEVSPRELFKAALLANAQSVILIHNHPSLADPVPSQEDLSITRKLIVLGKFLGLVISDHVIVNSVGLYISLRSKYPSLWYSNEIQNGDVIYRLE
jgi:DNA repair protein RadC